LQHAREWISVEVNRRLLHYFVDGMRGTVTGTQPGDSVKVWFERGGATSPSFTDAAETESSNRVLVLAAEDYSGASTFPPGYQPGPRPFYLSYYGDALRANGVGFDVYDVDAHGRKAPDALGVLSHYDAVVWYTGNDAITREPGWGGGNASRLAMDELLEVRAYLNDGGRLLYTGKFAGHQYTTAHGTQLYDPTAANAQCRADPAGEARCLAPPSGARSCAERSTTCFGRARGVEPRGAGRGPAPRSADHCLRVFAPGEVACSVWTILFG